MKAHDSRGTYAYKALALALLLPALGTIATLADAEPLARSERRSRGFENAHSGTGVMEAYTCDGCHAEVKAARSWVADPSKDFYRSSTMDAQLGPPDGTSRWCLQCHDGNIAKAGQGPSISGDGLGNDHPVSFVYDEALVRKDGGLHSPSSPSPLGGTIASDLLEDGKMQCTACHDFHTNRVKLLKTERQTPLCLACHDK